MERIRQLPQNLDIVKNILQNAVCAYCEEMGMSKNINPRPADVKIIRSR